MLMIQFKKKNAMMAWAKYEFKETVESKVKETGMTYNYGNHL